MDSSEVVAVVGQVGQREQQKGIQQSSVLLGVCDGISRSCSVSEDFSVNRTPSSTSSKMLSVDRANRSCPSPLSSNPLPSLHVLTPHFLPRNACDLAYPSKTKSDAAEYVTLLYPYLRPFRFT